MSDQTPNMSDMMRRIPDLDEPQVNEPARELDPSAILKKATGLDMSGAVDPTIQQPAQDSVSGITGPTFKEFLTPEELAQLGLDKPGEKIDIERESNIARNARADAQLSSKTNDFVDLLSEAITEEEKRVVEIDRKLTDPEAKEQLYQGDAPDSSRSVNYVAPIDGEDVSHEHEKSYITPREKVATDLPAPDDLVPSYDYEDDTETPEATEKTPEEERPNAGDEEEYVEYVKGLETADYDENDTVIDIKKEKVDVVATTVPSGRIGKTKILGDQAFLNSITKFKKDNFRTVEVPLVNSEFHVSMVGTGAVDLTLLYDNANQNTTPVDYELEKMRIIIRNIVDTQPKIDKNNLRNLIHFSDYQLMAYAHLAATLQKVELVHTCTECGKDFRISANSSDLLLNLNELRTKQSEIRNAESISECSLMDHDRRLTTADGFIITLGHPSYSDYIQYLSELRNLTENLNRGQAVRIAQLAGILPFIRSIHMPNGVNTNNLYQRFIATTMLSDSAYNEMTEEISKMAKAIINPKFGIRKVVCPYCQKENSEIAYENLNDLLFFHITVNRLLNAAES